jgi:hypothetical protein
MTCAAPDCACEHEHHTQLQASAAARSRSDGYSEPAELRRFNTPNTDPTNTNFGKVTTAVGAAGAMRFYNFVGRFTF